MQFKLTPVLRYWEYSKREISHEIDKLVQAGAHTVGAWIPWSHLETDHQHLLQIFIRAALEAGLGIRLGVTPEIGIGYTNGGIPDDLQRRPKNYSLDRTGKTIYACAPPNIHPLVSLTAPEVFQRYGHFLMKLVQEMDEVLKEFRSYQIELMITDSFFKHYRNIHLPSDDHGDFSALYSRKQTIDQSNWHQGQAEKVFKLRAYDYLKSRYPKVKGIKITSKNFWSRPASLDRLFDELFCVNGNYYPVAHDLLKRRSICEAAWLDDLNIFQDREINFLLSAALVFFGDVWVNANDYLCRSTVFRQKMQTLVSAFSTTETSYYAPVMAIVKNRFAVDGLSLALQNFLGASMHIQSASNDLRAENFTNLHLLFVDDGKKIDHEHFVRLYEQVQKYGFTMALFRDSLEEKSLLKLSGRESFHIVHEWNFDVYLFANGGHIIVMSGGPSSTSAWNTLAERLLRVAGVESSCDIQAKNISHVSIDWHNEQANKNTARTMFFVNSQYEPQEVNLHFTRKVKLEGIPMPEDNDQKNAAFMLPALSVIPMMITWGDENERTQATLE